MKLRSIGLLGVRCAVLAICVYMVMSGSHPPADAQGRIRERDIPVITTKDAVQDEQLDQINQHLISTDTRVQKEWDAINANAMAITGFQVEERLIGGLLAILTGSGIVIQLRRKPA